MSFDFELKADARGALTAAGAVEAALVRIERQAANSKAMEQAYATAGASAKNAKGEFQAAAAASKETASGMGDILMLAGQIATIHGAIHLVDEYTTISNRLRSVSTDQDNLNAIMERTFKVAQDTRTDWESLITVYQRFQMASRGAGTSQEQMMQFTETLSKGLRIGGATAFETQMSMMELAHSFAVGALTGREFRVMMKDATPFMAELSKASGKTAAEFAEMGKHGKITRDLILEWTAKAGPAIDEAFGKSIPTIAEGFVLMKNAAAKFFGEFATGSGVMSAVGAGMRFVSDHFETFGKILLSVIEVFVGFYVIEKVIAGIRALSLAIAANPLGALLLAITTGIALLRQFGDQINTQNLVWQNVAGVYVTVGDYLRALWDMFKNLGATVVDFVENAWSKLTGAFSNGIDSTGITLSLRNVLVFIGSFVDAAIAIFKGLKDTMIVVFGGIPLIIGEVFVVMARFIVDTIQGMINGVIGAYNKVRGALFDEVNKTDERRTAAQGRAAALNAKNSDSDRIRAANYVQANASPNATADQRQKMFDESIALRQRERLETSYGMAKLQPDGEDDRSGKIGKIDIAIGQTQLDGATVHARDKLKETWGKDFGSTVGREWANGFVDELDKKARDGAAARNASLSKTGDISKTPNAKEAEAQSKEEAKEMEKLEKALEAITRQSNPIVEAQEKLAHAEDITTRAVKAGLISWAQKSTIMGDTEKKLHAALFPFETMVDKILEETSLLQPNSREMKINADIQARLNKLRTEGLTPTAAQISQLSHLVRASEDAHRVMAEEQKIYESIKGPMDDVQIKLRALNKLKADDVISGQEYANALANLTQETLRWKKAMSAANQNVADQTTKGVSEGLTEIKNEVMDVSGAAKTALVDAFHGIEDAITATCTGGKAEWSKMVEQMERDLLKLAIRQLAFSALTGLGFGPGITSGGGFATGGTYTAGGSGGADSQHVMFRMSPGEKAEFTPKGQNSSSRSGGVSVHNHYDKRELLTAMDGPDGDRIIHNFIRRNPTAVGK